MQFSRIRNRSYVPSLQQQFQNQWSAGAPKPSSSIPSGSPSLSPPPSPSSSILGLTNIRSMGFTPGPKLSVQGMRQGRVGSSNQSRTTEAATPPPITPSDGNKMRWGAPTWTFFHVFAAQIRPAFFTEHREEIMQMLLTVASTLPCPICAQHAQEHLSRMGFLSRVQSQNQLKDFFYHFHNTVNRNKGYALYLYDDLARYDTANFALVCQQFLFHYRDKSRQTKLIADDLQRAVHANRIEAWLRTYMAKAFVPSSVSSPAVPTLTSAVQPNGATTTTTTPLS